LLAAAVIEPPPATQSAPSRSPHPRAPREPPELTIFTPEPPHHPFPCPTPVGAPPPSPSRGQTTPAPLRHHRERHRNRCELLNIFLTSI
jgi:hypothetical protein